MKYKLKFVLSVFFILLLSFHLVSSLNFSNTSSNLSNNNLSHNYNTSKVTELSLFNNKLKSDFKKNIEEKPNENHRVIVKVKEDKKEKVKNKYMKKQFNIKDNKLVSAEIDTNELQDLINDSDVIEIWPDRITKGFLDNSVYQIYADVAWDQNIYGTGIKIAVLDTGIDSSHPMLKGKVILQVDFTGTGVNDSYGHGTHVAGIITGNGTYTGVSPGVQIYNGKVLDDSGSGYLSWLINGINWAMDPDNNPLTDDGADIISLSLGATYSGEPEELLTSPEVEKIREAISRGIVVVIASGNCGIEGESSGCNGFYGVTTPGITPEAITVGAVNDNNEWASFSGGDIINDIIKPDIVSPGVDICSSVPWGYECWSGTSMATPHVAGAVALLLEKYDDLNPFDVKEILEETALDLGDAGKDVMYGSGLVDLSTALDYQLTTSLFPKINSVLIESGIIKEPVRITAEVSQATNVILKINDKIVAESNGNVDYTFIPKKEGSYSFEIIASNKHDVESYAGVIEIKNYEIIIPELVLNKNNQIIIKYTNNQKYIPLNKELEVNTNKLEKIKSKLTKDLTAGFYYNELIFTYYDEKEIKVLPKQSKELVFDFTPQLIGAYDLNFEINDEKISKQVFVNGQTMRLMDSVNMWVRG